MEKEEYRKHFELEKDFWWFSGKRKVILNILEFFNLLGRNLTLLDIGCGTGYNLKVFDKYFSSVGCEFSSYAIYFCKKRGLKKIIQSKAKKINKRRPLETPGAFLLLKTFFPEHRHSELVEE